METWASFAPPLPSPPVYRENFRLDFNSSSPSSQRARLNFPILNRGVVIVTNLLIRLSRVISLLIEFSDEGEREEFFLEAENILEPIIPYSSR